MTVRPLAFITACVLATGCAMPLSSRTAAAAQDPVPPQRGGSVQANPLRRLLPRRPRRRCRQPVKLPAASARIVESPDAFRIGPEDVLDVQVWKNDELSRVVPVRPDGMISLPLVNDIRAQG